MPAEPKQTRETAGSVQAPDEHPQRPHALFVQSAVWRNREDGPGWDALLSEFLSALLVWGGLGWLADRWLGTEPWLLAFGLVLGNGLGLYLLWLRTNPAPPAKREPE
ncbi:MAG: AtpZ/AtpI family protein [Egibacteraceae bacterium]